MESKKQQQEMVKNQLQRRGIKDPAVLSAMAEVPRHAFVPGEMKHRSYQDSPLPIGEGQTISQPYIVARMIEHLALGPEDRVLEIGTGSGYGAAVLSRIAKSVYTVERHRSLAESARKKLEKLGYGNVHVLEGDGTLGWPEHAPYDAVVGTAGAPDIPETLKEQLSPGGRIVLPVGSIPEQQVLVKLTKNEDGGFVREEKEPVRFVPMVGEAGWR